MLRGSLSHMVIYQRYIQTSMVSVITLSGSGLQYNTPGMLMDKGSRSDIRDVWGHLLAIIQPLIFTCTPCQQPWSGVTNTTLLTISRA